MVVVVSFVNGYQCFNHRGRVESQDLGDWAIRILSPISPYRDTYQTNRAILEPRLGGGGGTVGCTDPPAVQPFVIPSLLIVIAVSDAVMDWRIAGRAWNLH